MSFLVKLIPVLMIYSFGAIVALILVDTLLGMFTALIKGKWSWVLIGHWLETAVLPIIGSLIFLAFLAIIQMGLQTLVPNSPLLAFFHVSFLTIFYAAAATAAAKLLADIVTKINSWGIVVIPTNEPTTIASGKDTPSAG